MLSVFKIGIGSNYAIIDTPRSAQEPLAACLIWFLQHRMVTYRLCRRPDPWKCLWGPFKPWSSSCLLKTRQRLSLRRLRPSSQIFGISRNRCRPELLSSSSFRSFIVESNLSHGLSGLLHISALKLILHVYWQNQGTHRRRPLPLYERLIVYQACFLLARFESIDECVVCLLTMCQSSLQPCVHAKVSGGPSHPAWSVFGPGQHVVSIIVVHGDLPPIGVLCVQGS